MIDGYIQQVKTYTEVIKDQIGYDEYTLKDDSYIPIDELDELIQMIVRAICSEKEKYTICGQEYPHEVVKSVLLKVNINCLERTVDKVKTIDDIRNLEKYFLSTLFNEINNQHFTSNNGERWADYAVKRDFGY